MKTFKFLAMLLAAFALTFSFTSCGDDEDDNAPAHSEGQGQLAIAGTTGNLTEAYCYYDAGSDKTFVVFTDMEHANVEIIFSGNILAGNKLPVGSFPYEDPHADSQQYYIQFNINNIWGSGIEGTGNLNISRNGNSYTVTIDRLVALWANHEAGTNGEVTTTFRYQGGIDYLDWEHR